MTTLGERSIREVVEEWRPRYNDKWKRWIRESYGRYRSNADEDRLCGAKDFATILGDSGAPELCVLVALYGLRFAKAEKDRNSLESHIRIITCSLGIERHKESFRTGEGVPCVDFANREKWLIDRQAWEHWRNHKLQDFENDRQVASDCSVRLACIHAGLLFGEVALTFESLCDPSLWRTCEA
jgi:hypothetical protein